MARSGMRLPSLRKCRRPPVKKPITNYEHALTGAHKTPVGDLSSRSLILDGAPIDGVAREPLKRRSCKDGRKVLPQFGNDSIHDHK
jgi:hypothetical protein